MCCAREQGECHEATLHFQNTNFNPLELLEIFEPNTFTSTPCKKDLSIPFPSVRTLLKGERVTRRYFVGTFILSLLIGSALSASLAGKTLLLRKTLVFNGKDLAYTFKDGELVPRSSVPGASGACEIQFKPEVRNLPADRQRIEPGTTLELGSAPRGSLQIPIQTTPDILAFIACPEPALAAPNRAPASAAAPVSPWGEYFVQVGGL